MVLDNVSDKKVYLHEYYLRNKEKHTERAKQYYEQNKHKWKGYNKRRSSSLIAPNSVPTLSNENERTGGKIESQVHELKDANPEGEDRGASKSNGIYIIYVPRSECLNEALIDFMSKINRHDTQ